MLYWHHTKLLIWKNFKRRSRQKIRTLSEIFLPLTLFVLVVSVIQGDVTENHHACHFEEKAMPSMGPQLFVKSFFCGFNNTCHSSPPTEDGSLPSYNSSFVDRLLSDLEDSLYMSFDEERAAVFSRVIQDMSSLSKLSAKARKQFAAGLSMQGFNISSLNNIIYNEDDFVKKLNVWLKSQNVSSPVSEDALRGILNASIDVSHLTGPDWLSLLGSPLSIFCKPSVSSKLFYFHHPMNRSLEVELAGICGLGAPASRGLLSLIKDHANMEGLQQEFDELTSLNGQIQSFNIKDWSIFSQTLRDLQSHLLSHGSIKSIMGDVSNTLREYSESVNLAILRQKHSEKQALEMQLEALFALLHKFICQGRKSAFRDIFSNEGKASYLEEFRASIKAERNEEVEYQYDETTSKECNDLMQMLESDPIFALIWKQLKPLIRGKIVYTPDTPATRRIIKVIQKAFDPIIATIRSLRVWTNDYSSLIRSIVLKDDNIAYFTDLFTDDTDGNFLDLILRHEFVDVLNQEGDYYAINASDIRQGFNTYFSQDIASLWKDNLDDLDDLIGVLTTYLSCFETDKFFGVPTEFELEKAGFQLIDNNKLWAGLVFKDMPPDHESDTLPEFITYKIRMNSISVDNTRQIQDRTSTLGARRDPTVDLKYQTFGFAFLQDMTEHAIISIHSGRNSSQLPGISLQQMPYPCYSKNSVIEFVGGITSTLMFLSWMQPVSGIVKNIIYEKEERLKEMMKAIGLGSEAYWTSVLIDSVFVTLPTAIIVSFLTTGGGIYYFADVTVMLFVFISYTVSTICFCFLLSTFFSKSNSAGFAAGFIYFISSLPIALINRLNVSYNVQFVACLLSNVAFGNGMKYIIAYEKSGVGIQWSNFLESPFDFDEFSLGLCVGFLWLDALIYSLFAWYIGNVFPGEFGIPKPFYFPFSLSYWKGSKPALLAMDSRENLRKDSSTEDIEKEPTHLPLGISIQNLHKVYPNGKVAVEDLSLNFYESQITSFLGHNGAGKTTTINIMTGLYPPTAGTVKVYGHDICKETDVIRQSLGICPQYNVLFHYLTVKEHCQFFSLLKNPENSINDPEIDSIIQEIGLGHKKHEFAPKLSGGMKRKLSIGLALVGGSKVIILDEPTAGVDPYSRRSIWDILIRYKAGRTIILTTHFMDEADLLGDRIAIISQGNLMTCGSSLFLRNRFGNGYYLTIDRYALEDNDALSEEDDDEEHEEGDTLSKDSLEKELDSSSSSSGSMPTEMLIDDEGISDVSKVDGVVINPSSSNVRAKTIVLTKFVQKHIPDARLLEQLGSETLYLLPTEDYDNSIKKFEGLFLDLEENLKSFQIRSFGLSNTTMEEIFLTVVNNSKVMEVQRQTVYDEKRSSRHRLTSSSSLSAKHSATKQDLKQEFATSSSCNDALKESNFKNLAESSEKEAGCVYTKEKNERKKLRLPRIKKRTVIRQSIALLLKRFHQHRRDKKVLLAEIFFPFIFIALSALCLSQYTMESNEPELPLNPWIYPLDQNLDLYTFFANSHKGADWPERYEEQLLSRIGMGDKCVNRKEDTNNCTGKKPDLSNFDPDESIDYNAISPSCDCDSEVSICDEPIRDFYPPETRMPSGEILQNLNGRNISDFLLKTRFEYQGRRFGGLEFGVLNPLAGLNFDGMERMFTRLTKATNMNKSRVDSFTSNFVKETLLDSAYSSSLFDYIRVWFNNKGWASSVAYMNAVNNIVLRAAMEEKSYRMFDIIDSTKYGIAAINHPMNYTSEQLSSQEMYGLLASVSYSVNILIVLSILPASYVMSYVLENNLKIKHLHFVYGVKIPTYWISGYIFDIILFCLNLVIITFALIAVDASSLVSDENFSGFATLVLLYSFAVMPMMYLLSFLFKNQSSALVILLNLNLLLGVVPFMTMITVRHINEDKYLADILETLFLLSPQFCLINGLFQMMYKNMVSSLFEEMGFTSNSYAFDWDYLGRSYLFLSFQGVIFLTLTIMVDMKFFDLWHSKFFMAKMRSELNEVEGDLMDEDVFEEYQRVMNAYEDPNNDENALLVKELSKRYWRKKKRAVDSLSFGVRRGECFGLLGVNGAGKTTTFKMLTGDINPSAGDAFINGYSIFHEMSRCRQSLGYCPQEDALHPLLTGREHLELYARLRGVNKVSETKLVNHFLKELGLLAYCDQLTHTYSGGNKRKLCTAISLIGTPSTIFLDEPTSGMDPGSRRFLWNCVLDVIRGGQSVVLTSHSMEECEVLCNRLGIMVNGKFKCLGTAQHLKSRFGSGYSLTLRSGTTNGDLEPLKDFVKSSFPSSDLKEEHYNQLTYQIPLAKTKLSTIFHEMERARSISGLLLEDYSLTQTTLDEVFIRFASEQTENSDSYSESDPDKVETTAL